MERKDYYIYVMVDTDGVYRYLGKGRNNRFKIKVGRTLLQREFMESELFAGSKLLHKNLTEEEAISIENEYLEKYVGKVVDGWNLLNVKKSSIVKSIDLHRFSELFYLDKASPSHLSWKVDRKGHNGGCKIKAGYHAGSLSKSTGYYNVIIDGVSFLVHRIVWSLYNNTPADPRLVINHIDSYRQNNNPSNLEQVSVRDNNLKATSRQLGSIRFRSKANAFEVRWTEDNKQRGKYFNLRNYPSKEAALEAANQYLSSIRSSIYKLDSEV